MSNEPHFQQIRDAFSTLLIVLGRPAVQRQVLVLISIVFLAWLFSHLLGRLLRAVAARLRADRRPGNESSRSAWPWRLYRWLRVVQYTVFPILGLVLGEMAIRWFESNQWPAGLIEQLRPAFWLFLAYRILLGIMQAVLSEKRSRTYSRHFLTPVFVIIVLGVIGTNLAGAFGIGDLELIQVLGATITLGNLVNAIVLLYIFVVFAWLARDIINLLASRRGNFEAGAIHAVTMIVYYTTIGVGALTALAVLGFDLSRLVIIFGGLSVGLGFGLQELVSNFVSGILLLFEQSLRVGDVISVGGKSGTVDQLQMRATVLRTLDNEEIFVPNRDLLTSSVETYTHTDRLVRRVVSVGVSYASDPLQIRELLLEIGDRHGQILKHPAPQVFFADFGDSSLDFELFFWLDDPPTTAAVRSDLRFMIWTEFTKHGIEIPFPQRDIHVHKEAIDAPVPSG